MPRVAIYDRISKLTDTSTSIARQDEVCEQYARTRWGSDVEIEYFRDEDISAFDAHAVRPDYDRLLANVARFDGLVVYRIDRLTRRGARHLLELVEDVLEPAGCVLASATEPVDTGGAFAELFLVLLAIFAKMESQRLSERGKAAWGYLTKTGRFRGARIPYGYAKVAHEEGGWRLTAREDEASVVRTAAGRILAGEALLAVSRDLGWPEGSLRSLLLNPVVAGYQAEDGQRIVFHDGQPVTVADTPILDPQMWRRVAAILEERKGTRPSRERTLLAGLVRCAECGRPMTGKAAGRSPSYNCRTRWTDGPGACPGVSVSMGSLEAFVIAALEAALPQLLARGARVLAQREADTRDPAAERLLHLEQLQKHLHLERDGLVFDQGRDFTDPDVRAITASIERARGERDRLVAERELSRRRDNLHELQELMENVDVEGLDVDRLRRAIGLVFDRIEVSKAAGRGVPFDPGRVRPVPRQT